MRLLTAFTLPLIACDGGEPPLCELEPIPDQRISIGEEIRLPVSCPEYAVNTDNIGAASVASRDEEILIVGHFAGESAITFDDPRNTSFNVDVGSASSLTFYDSFNTDHHWQVPFGNTVRKVEDGSLYISATHEGFGATVYQSIQLPPESTIALSVLVPEVATSLGVMFMLPHDDVWFNTLEIGDDDDYWYELLGLPTLRNTDYRFIINDNSRIGRGQEPEVTLPEWHGNGIDEKNFLDVHISITDSEYVIAVGGEVLVTATDDQYRISNDVYEIRLLAMPIDGSVGTPVQIDWIKIYDSVQPTG